MPTTFTEEQKQIFHFVENSSEHGIIDAVAGAGKTTTIMECVRYVPNKSSVLFCAFNNSIANEISRKFKENEMHDVTVKTIHALGRQILQSNNNTGNTISLENRKYNELLKNEDIQEKMKPFIFNILKINNLNVTKSLEDRNDFAVNNLIAKFNVRLLNINQKARSTLTKEEPGEFENLVIHFGIFNQIESKKKSFKEELKNYFDCHCILLEEGNKLSEKTMTIDYTDMLYLPYKWNLYPPTKFDFLFIDECQDLSKSQLAVALKYGKPSSRILSVGDPSQSIYGFTGADIESFSRIKDTTKATQLPLTSCFRCPQKVIELAKEIRADITGFKSEQGIVNNIAFEDIIKLARPNDLIISRLRAPLVLLVFSFIDHDIKVQIHEEEVKDIIHEIKSIFKPNELNMLISSRAGGFMDLKADVLNRWKRIINRDAQRIIDSAERDIYIKAETKYLEQKLEFLNRKHEQWKEECSNLEEILKKIKAFISAPYDAVKLSTIHRAKGLENNRVFILNYDELPYYRLEQKPWEKTQELNLKYVALTRSKSELYLVESKKLDVIKNEGSLFDSLPMA